MAHSFRGEYHWKNPARADGLCGGGANPAFAGGVPCYYSTLGRAVSTDGGNTFRVAGESLQLTDSLTASKGTDTSRNIGYGIAGRRRRKRPIYGVTRCKTQRRRTSTSSSTALERTCPEPAPSRNAPVSREHDMTTWFRPCSREILTRSRSSFGSTEKLTGQSYAENLNQYIFQPLGLKSTYYSLPPVGQSATGYTNNGAGLVPAILWNRSAAFAAGALSSNIYDLVEWDNALMNGKVVSPASFKTMTASNGFAIPAGGSYGFGVALWIGVLASIKKQVLNTEAEK